MERDIDCRFLILRDWIPLERIRWQWMCYNLNSVELLKQHPDKIVWEFLSLNPNAMEILKKNI